MTALEYMERELLRNRLNFDREACRKGVTAEQLENIRKKISHYEAAVDAQREREERSKGCEYCREAENIYYHAGAVNSLDELVYITGDDLVVDIGCRFYLSASIKFCPVCGRRLYGGGEDGSD